MTHIRRSFYRYINNHVIESFFLHRFMPGTGSWRSFSETLHSFENVQKTSSRKRVWFHAASAGELESLWTVITSCADLSFDLILTAFSPSAAKPMKRLCDEIVSRRGHLIYAGPCPWEGGWLNAFSILKPDIFVTTKYEAWPDLWMSLAEIKIPLFIVSASARNSIKFGKISCRLLGSKIPRIIFFSTTKTEADVLRSMFKFSDIHVIGDPRWDRVKSRAVSSSNRAKILCKSFGALNRPIVIIGSAWLEDMKQWKNNPPMIDGSLIIVPHHCDQASINEMQNFLSKSQLIANHYGFIKSSDMSSNISGDPQTVPTGNHVILVDEMGVLAELYSLCDFAFIGGGFGKGVHSTIEPALHGIPIACGPARAKSFPEISELLSIGQLRIVKNSRQLAEWLKVGLNIDLSMREYWKNNISEKFGATGRIINVIVQKLKCEGL